MSPAAKRKPVSKADREEQARDRATRLRNLFPRDEVEIESDDSFPASDAPSWTSVSRVGIPQHPDSRKRPIND